jgi:hypothetical protein
MNKSKRIFFKGPCPFLLCIKTKPHSHPVCPECRSVRYGNLYCPTCKKFGHRIRIREINLIKKTLKREKGGFKDE